MLQGHYFYIFSILIVFSLAEKKGYVNSVLYIKGASSHISFAIPSRQHSFNKNYYWIWDFPYEYALKKQSIADF